MREFGGDHRFVADYLNHEIMGSLDEDSRWLLLRTSVLGDFTAELCDSVFERTDAVSKLESLEHSNLFVARLEHGGWFRVHPLFAEFAEFQLESSDPGVAGDIHRRAALWFLERGLLPQAVEHAAAAQDHDLLAHIVSENHLPLIRSGGARTLVRWAQMLPDEQLVEHPELTMAAAAAVSLVGPRTIDRRRFVQLAERARGGARFTPYVDAGIGMVRSFTFDIGVQAGVERSSRGRDRGAGGGRRRWSRRWRAWPTPSTSPATSRALRRRPTARWRTRKLNAGPPPTPSPARRSPWPTSTAASSMPPRSSPRRLGR